MSPCLYDRVLLRRAAVCIQRWWRGTLGRFRWYLLVHARALMDVRMPSRHALLPISAVQRAQWLDELHPRALAPEQALAACFGYQSLVH